MRTLITALCLTALAGCTNIARINDKDGNEAILIMCGAALPFSVCHKRAFEECPNGYYTLSEVGGFNRKELQVRCKPARAKA